MDKNSMKVKVLYFAILREQVGKDEAVVELDAGSTVGTLARRLQEASPNLKNLEGFAKVAVNEDFVPYEHALRDGDEVAFIPPVAGG